MKELTKIRADIAKAQKLELLLMSIESELQSLPEPKLVMATTLWGAEVNIHWKVDTVAQMKDILTAFPPVVVTSVVKGSNTALKPEALAEERETCEPIEPVHFKLTSGQQGYPMHTSDLSACWMTSIKGKIARVEISTVDSAVTENWPNLEVRIEKKRSGDIAHTAFNRNAFSGNSVRWASGSASASNDYSLYFRRTPEDDPLGIENTLHFIEMLES